MGESLVLQRSRKILKKIKETADTSGFKWLHQSFGSNWRMTEIQAAIGRIQLGKLNDWVDERRKNAEYLYRGLSSVVGLNIPLPPEHVKHAYYRFYMFLEKEKLSEGWDQLRILERISSFGVPCFVGSCGEIYKEEAFGLFRIFMKDNWRFQLFIRNQSSIFGTPWVAFGRLGFDSGNRKKCHVGGNILMNV